MSYEKLKKLAELRMQYFIDNKDTLTWYKWSETYFDAVTQEVAETKTEDKQNNTVYLEDELWDVFWTALMLAQSLKAEWKISSIDAVLERAYNKFSERIGRDWAWGEGNWDEIKAGQKLKRKQEHENKYHK